MGEENCRETISSEELFFFDRKPAALPMYEVFRKSVLAEIPEAGIEVGKTQVSFFIGHMFAAVSFTPVRKAKDRPDPFLTITFGLPRRVESTRINAAAEPRPGRWTHHVMGSGRFRGEEIMMASVKDMKVSRIYPLLVAKAERKGRTKAEVDEIIQWLTGYEMGAVDQEMTYAEFLDKAPAYNPGAERITGSVCGVKVETIDDPLMKKIRQLDKLIDELAKGRPMEKILR